MIVIMITHPVIVIAYIHFFVIVIAIAIAIIKLQSNRNRLLYNSNRPMSVVIAKSILS